MFQLKRVGYKTLSVLAHQKHISWLLSHKSVWWKTPVFFKRKKNPVLEINCNWDRWIRMFHSAFLPLQWNVTWENSSSSSPQHRPSKHTWRGCSTRWRNYSRPVIPLLHRLEKKLRANGSFMLKTTWADLKKISQPSSLLIPNITSTV